MLLLYRFEEPQYIADADRFIEAIEVPVERSDHRLACLVVDARVMNHVDRTGAVGTVWRTAPNR